MHHLKSLNQEEKQYKRFSFEVKLVIYDKITNFEASILRGSLSKKWYELEHK